MVCAKELNIPQISEYMKHMGITDEELEQVQGEFLSLLKDLTSNDETIMSSLNDLIGKIEG